ncbi:hypothetical protein C4J81_06650 [Deltaproteobacteria bacterium Smac51]|nr:hypothetical protein C4J81_06650 [Deltaproteobacteria bacterium Smac51]
MKIYQFTPVSPPKESRAADKTGLDKAGGPDGDFASFLKKASTGESASPPGEAVANPGRVISMENMRALKLPSATDLGAAGKLLNRLESAIKSASLETLEKVHNLEGLLYIHNKNTPA